VSCSSRIPFAWRPGTLADPAASLRAALLFFTAFNHIEAQQDTGGGGEHANPGDLARVEAKLDLALHLLARALAPEQALPVEEVLLSASHLSWAAPTPPAPGQAVVLEMQPCPALPLSVCLPGRVTASDNSRVQVAFEALPEPLAEALHQFVFRRHRQAIRLRALHKNSEA